jgi:hypothetical protein
LSNKANCQIPRCFLFLKLSTLTIFTHTISGSLDHAIYGSVLALADLARWIEGCNSPPPTVWSDQERERERERELITLYYQGQGSQLGILPHIHFVGELILFMLSIAIYLITFISHSIKKNFSQINSIKT